MKKNSPHAFSPIMPAFGSAYLSARAILQNGRDIPGNPRSVVFDAIVPSSDETTSHITCSLRYVTPYAARFIHGGTYDIFAKVHVLAYYAFLCSCLQVVSFQSGAYLASPARSLHQFDLIGDILQVLLFGIIYVAF